MTKDVKLCRAHYPRSNGGVLRGCRVYTTRSVAAAAAERITLFHDSLATL